MFGSVPRRGGAQKADRSVTGGCLGANAQGLEEAVGLRKTPVEGFYNFLAHFVAAGSNRWPRRGDQFLRIGTKRASHIPDGFLDDPRQRAAPTGMDGRHRTLLGVHQQLRQAVSDSDGQQDAGPRGHQPIAGRRIGGGRKNVGPGQLKGQVVFAVASDHPRVGRMHLP